MPRTLLDARRERWDKLRRLLVGYKITAGKTSEELGRMVGCCDETINARLKRPDEIKLGDLAKLIRVLHIPLDEAMVSIQESLRY